MPKYLLGAFVAARAKGPLFTSRRLRARLLSWLQCRSQPGNGQAGIDQAGIELRGWLRADYVGHPAAREPSRGARALALAVLYVLLAAWPAPAQRFGPTQVEVAAVRTDVVRSTLSSVGTIIPELSSTISAEAEGQVRVFSLQEGDGVKAGQLICKIDSTAKEIEVRVARANLRKARAALMKTQRGMRKEEIAQRRAQVENRRANAERLKLKLERAEKLHAQKVIALDDVQDARLNYQAAKAEVQRTLEELAEAETGSREEDVMAAEAEVAARRATVQRLLDELRRFVVTAPFGGFIAARHAEVGEYIRIGSPVVDLVKLDRVFALTEINEKELGELRKGLPVELRADAYPSTTFRGVVEHIYPRANQSTRAFPVKIAVRNAEFRLKAGMFVRLRLILDERPVTLVPKDAIVDRNGPTVFVVMSAAGSGPDTVRHVRVNTGVTKRDFVAVDGDVKPGQRVVVTGNEFLRPGAPVRIIQ